jgi:hypothetical protein
MGKKTTLTENDLKVIKALLEDEYTSLTEGLADSADISAVIIPLLKMDALIQKAAK